MAAPSVTVPKVGPYRKIQAKHGLFIVFGLLGLVTIYTRDLQLLDPNSALRQHFTPIPRLILLHGIPGTIAMILGVLQFSNRLRSRYLRMHRILGRIYVGSVFIAAPAALGISFAIGPPILRMADIIQSCGWMLCTGIALYCVRAKKIQQHREWMMRSYPYAMVFVFVRATFAIPAVQRLGEVGAMSVVWTWIALCGFVPSIFIALQQTFKQPAIARSQRAGE
jgi:uncharacterized membrane protein